MPGAASECQKVVIFGDLGTKVNPHTLECNIDHTVGLFGRFSLFHTCIDQKVHHVVYYSHLDSHVV